MIKRSESIQASTSSEPQPARTSRKRIKRNLKPRGLRKRNLMLEGLEQRQMMAGDTLSSIVSSALNKYPEPRNLGTVQAFSVIEAEAFDARGQNDSFATAQLIPLGNQTGQRNTVDLVGNTNVNIMSQTGLIQTDLDFYAVDLKAGDIFDLAVTGSVSNITVYDEGGALWFSTDVNNGEFGYTNNSPLQTFGNAAAAQVVPEDGRYYFIAAPSASPGPYTYGLRTYRPVTESLAVGQKQILYVDFDGGFYSADQFNRFTPTGGIVNIPSLQESLSLLNIDDFDVAATNRLIREVMAEVKMHFQSIADNGSNGDFAATGIAGQYGIEIRNSLDDPDPGFNNPLVTRVVVGGTNADLGDIGGNLLGVSPSGDIGNFNPNEIVLSPLDLVLDYSTQFPFSSSASVLDAIARTIAVTVSHEAAHSFGAEHTNGLNNVGSLIDGTGPRVPEFDLGVGPDQIFGTPDDTEIEFVVDRFSTTETYTGVQYVPQALSWVLSTGQTGGGITGRVFNDLNRNGNGTGDLGLAGVTVFADINGNQVADPSEPTAVTNASGQFTLTAAPGTYNIIAIAPTNFVPTTPASKSTTVSLSGVAGVDFGFSKVQADITGTKFSDNDGDGFQDPGEAGIGGVYIYLDLDGDKRPDLGEPSAITKPDGSYSINFPGPGTYTIREVVEPGFVQTFPAGGEHVVVFDGTVLSDNYNFGNLPSRDFGDAPDSYLTTEAVGGAAHGILTGLTIGSTVDRELDGQPSVGADGDDNNGSDDEDGVRQATPFGLGSTGKFSVNVTNTSGLPAYLQGFVDFDGDGTFNGVGERLAEKLIPSGVTDSVQTIDVAVPQYAVVGTTYTRFRLSQTQGLGPAGFAETGEVEDHLVSILPTNNVANDDLNEQVSRNSDPKRLLLLANDFETAENPLTIVSVGTGGTNGSVRIATDDGGRSVFYTPQNGFTGRDVFTYTVSDVFNNLYTATVVVEVTFQSNVPIAIDDVFSVPEGAQNRALNVLDNDVPSLSGGLSITSVTPGSAGGNITIIGGGQSLRYTPASSFAGTEQFSYSVQDGAGSTSSAQVTVNMLPGSAADDLVEFSIDFFDPLNNTPITNLQLNSTNPAANRFGVRVSVDDLNQLGNRNPEGVASAFLDLLYTDELVKTVAANGSSAFPFDISFGPLFAGGTFQQGNSQKPGLIDDVGGVQIVNNTTPFNGRVELFTITFEALSPGVAVFAADPADDARSETVLIGEDVALTPSQLRLGRNEFVIFAGNGNFVTAIDDAFMQGVDSAGQTISASSSTAARLDVLGNDRFSDAQLQEFGVVVQPQNGSLTINNNNTPSNLNDDFFQYRPNNNPSASGFDQFTYVIVTDEGIRSTAQVTLAYGNANSDDQVLIGLNLVNAGGQPINSNQIGVGDRFGVQVSLEDLRNNSTFVFAGFLDMLYDAGMIRPANTNLADDFDFDVNILSNYNASAAVGTASRLGIIDEFGTVTTRTNAAESEYPSLNPATMATIYFDAIAPGSSVIASSPADASPFQDTLLYREDDPVPTSRIRYEALHITIGTGGQGESPLQNSRLPADVNNDGEVTPIDALHVINEMARAVPSGAQGEAMLVSPYYVDVNGDRSITALDALTVINELSRRAKTVGNSGEGERVVADNQVVTAILPQTNSAPSDKPASDSVFAELSNGNAKAVATDVSSDSQAATAVVLAAGSVDDSNDDDEMLDLLADDLAGLLS
ncbi:Dockerin type I repeat protein [Novipirellula galeiformis]|uniref:Dockerin type I repeat protein n=1 Tax=Novipirellula galeiformis TaxID=2528004 RepID=A0A5C6CLZ3_9BACT|nr:Ig-like domain-containing protein [Novipirellula galeiformis]TWU24176.1 Dockerin type I repeat protein [Novipirellula galeiformis]